MTVSERDSCEDLEALSVRVDIVQDHVGGRVFIGVPGDVVLQQDGAAAAEHDVAGFPIRAPFVLKITVQIIRTCPERLGA